MKRILLVEDEENLHLAIKLNLEMEGYNVISIYNGKNAVSKFKEGRFDLIILDVMLPEMNGFDICQTIRLENSIVPILFLTAKATSDDKIRGLKMADDYLTKPFHLPELLLRIKGILRRSEWYKEPVHDQEIFRFEKMWINFGTGKANGIDGEFSFPHLY